MKPAEIISQRIDRLNEALNPAVRRSGGGDFALMLSMIAESQSLASRLERAGGAAQEPAPLRREDLYSAQLVGRMGEALLKRQLGDLHMAVSWVETFPINGRHRPLPTAETGEAGVPLSQAALMANRYPLLEEIKESRHRVAA